jgi:hypothetical protein
MLASSSSSTTSETPSSSKSMPADLEEGLHQLAQEGIRAHVGGDIVDRLLVRVGDARREQAVGNGLRVHVGEAVGVEVVDERLLERLHQLGERALVGLDGERGLESIADVAGQFGQPDRKFFRGGDHLAVAERERGAPALAPGFGIAVIGGPGEVLAQFAGHGVEVQRGIAVVPAEHLEGWQIVAVLRAGELGEADLPLLPFPVVGDEEQIVRSPGGAFGAVGGGALLERHLTQDAAQRDDGKLLRLELDEEDAPGLLRRERTQTLDLLDLGGRLWIDPELVRGEFVEEVVHLLERIPGDRPAHLIAQVRNELIETLDRGQRGAVVGRHWLSLR